MLKKYHKQTHSKKFKKHYQDINLKYKLNLNANKDLDLLKLSIFETGLKQKKFFQDEYEAVRNNLFDMWDHLSFYERNDLILRDISEKIESLSSFEYKDVKIYIPFFDELLNSLFATEMAILELPQYFQLYDDFNERLTSSDIYGLDPFINGFTFCDVISSTEDAVVLYDPLIKVFYKVTDNLERFPIYIKSLPKLSEIQAISDMILYDNNKDLIPYLVEKELMSPKGIKKYLNQEKKKLVKGKD